MSDYSICNDTLIFLSNFNGDLLNYTNILSKYNKLIFSDYDDPLICIETNNKIDKKYKKTINIFCKQVNLPSNLTHLTFGDCFNKSVNETLVNLTHLTFGTQFNQLVILPTNLTHLTFGTQFNQPVILPTNLTHLTFSYKFNQSINLPSELTHLSFGYNFNQYVNLPSKLTHLIFGYNFNQQINIPTSVKYLKLSCDNCQYIVDNLPNAIDTLEFNCVENLELNNLPNDIKKIKFSHCCYYKKELNCLPKSIEYIILNESYDKKISNIPTNLKTLECSKDYKFINDFMNKYNIQQY
jgi:hypothetical protein